MQRFLTVLVLCLAFCVAAVADTPHASLITVKHHVTHHHAHKAGKHHVVKHHAHHAA